MIELHSDSAFYKKELVQKYNKNNLCNLANFI